MCELMRKHTHADRIKTARCRQAGVLAGEEIDYLPIDFADRSQARLSQADRERLAAVPHHDWAQQWHDPAKSLVEQLKGELVRSLSGSDGVPGVRADMGVINCMTVFGAEFVVPAHTKPVINKYVPKDTLREFDVPDDISELGIMPRMVEHMQHHQGVLREAGLGETVSVFHCDQQGPFDVAAQARGHEIFVDLYDDPAFVHVLMDKCTDVYVKVSRLCKQVNGEPLDGGNAVHVWMKNGGVRMCGDSDILVLPEHYREFVLPYQARAFAAFGGGWLHYCGGWPGTGRSEGTHLHESYAQVEGLRGINWTTRNDWVAEMRKLRELGPVFIGGLMREPDESLESYFRRALSAYDRKAGLLFTSMHGTPDDPDLIMETWHRLQDERFG